jgi:hypothetical protein
MTLSIPVNTDDLAIIAPPDIIEVAVDIGPTGQRGSKVFVGAGDPNLQTSNGVIFGQNLYLNDLYINVSPGTDYSYMYQYISAPGSDQWESILKVNPALHARLDTTVDFTSGTSNTILIPISSIVTVTGAPLVASNFNVQHNIQYTDLVSSSISNVQVSGSNLAITIKAMKYSGAWQALTATDVSVHLFISVNTTVV